MNTTASEWGELDHGAMRTATGITGGIGYLYERTTFLPMRLTDWKKLARETQIKVLEELGILNAE